MIPTKKLNLQLNPMQVDEKYAKEWNIHSNDFFVLASNGEILRNTLYRKGGLNHNLKVGADKYFILIKYTEEIYSEEFIKECYPNKSKK